MNQTSVVITNRVDVASQSYRLSNAYVELIDANSNVVGRVRVVGNEGIICTLPFLTNDLLFVSLDG
jgi:hypothetical protein